MQCVCVVHSMSDIFYRTLEVLVYKRYALHISFTELHQLRKVELNYSWTVDWRMWFLKRHNLPSHF